MSGIMALLRLYKCGTDEKGQMMFLVYAVLTVVIVWCMVSMFLSDSSDVAEAFIGFWCLLGLCLLWAAIKDAYRFKMLWEYVPLTGSEWLGILLGSAMLGLFYKVSTLD
jgi:hypothetical protein